MTPGLVYLVVSPTGPAVLVCDDPGDYRVLAAAYVPDVSGGVRRLNEAVTSAPPMYEAAFVFKNAAKEETPRPREDCYDLADFYTLYLVVSSTATMHTLDVRLSGSSCVVIANVLIEQGVGLDAMERAMAAVRRACPANTDDNRPLASFADLSTPIAAFYGSFGPRV